MIPKIYICYSNSHRLTFINSTIGCNDFVVKFYNLYYLNKLLIILPSFVV